MQIIAPAKVNFFLHITGKRADGYHLLDSLVAFTDFGDTVTLRKAADLQLSTEGPFAQKLQQDNADNLVIRAAKLLQMHSGCNKGAHITLQKNIPIGAGLGGGSSDAAATLLGLSQLWDLKISHHELAALALQLGSDVPVCLMRGVAQIQGIGEQISPISVPPDFEGYGILLVNPLLPLLTADVYRKFAGAFSAPLQLPATISLSILQETSNALEEPAKLMLPVISKIIGSIAASPQCLLARMSGSGATCFGLYKNMADAEAAMKMIQQNHPQWWVQVASWFKGDKNGKA